jgi:hypothetical protein
MDDFCSLNSIPLEFLGKIKYGGGICVSCKLVLPSNFQKNLRRFASHLIRTNHGKMIFEIIQNGVLNQDGGFL